MSEPSAPGDNVALALSMPPEQARLFGQTVIAAAESCTADSPALIEQDLPDGQVLLILVHPEVADSSEDIGAFMQRVFPGWMGE